MDKKIIYIIGGVAVLGIGIGYFLYNKNKKNKNKLATASFEQGQGQGTQPTAEKLKDKILSIDKQLNTPEMSKKWGQEDYVSLQNERRQYAKELEKLGWKSISKQQSDGSFLQQFVKI